MPRPEKQKLKLMYVKQILEEYTDEAHGITMDRLLELLAMRGVKTERKSVYDDIDTLMDEGMDIQKPSGKDHTYRLLSREFSIAELKLMIDSIQASKFLSETTSREIIRKLNRLCSTHEAVQLQRSVILTNRVKNIESQMASNVDTINRAIAEGKQITYKYFDYTAQKRKVYRGGGEPYVRSPYALVYSDENYYMLAYDAARDQIRPYRVDRMEKVKLLALDRAGQEAFEKIDLAQYQKYTFSMFAGKVENVSMVFSNRMVNAVMDRFGRDVLMLKEDEGHFKITVPVAVSPQFFGWIFGLGELAKIVWPEHVVEQMKNALNTVQSKYH